MNDFNLLPAKQTSNFLSGRYERLAAVIVGVITLVWLVIFVGLFLYSHSLQSQQQDLQDQTSEVNSEINSNKELIGNLLLLKQKTAAINYLEKNKFPFPGGFSDALKLVPSGINISRLTMDDGGHVSFSLSANDVNAASAFISELTSQSLFKNPLLSGFRTDENLDFNFNVLANYGNPNLKSN